MVFINLYLMLVQVKRNGVILNVPDATYESKKHLFTPVESSSEAEGESSDKSFTDTKKAVVKPKKK